MDSNKLKLVEDLLIEHGVGKAVLHLDNVEFAGVTVNTHAAKAGLPLDQTFIRVHGKTGAASKALIEEFYILVGAGSFQCPNVSDKGADGMGKCTEQTFSGGKKVKTMPGIVVSAGATVRGSAVCRVIRQSVFADKVDICSGHGMGALKVLSIPWLNYATVGLQYSTVDVDLKKQLATNVQLPTAFGAAKDITKFKKQLRLFGTLDIKAAARKFVNNLSAAELKRQLKAYELSESGSKTDLLNKLKQGGFYKVFTLLGDYVGVPSIEVRRGPERDQF